MSDDLNKHINIVIIGGGFGGIRCALDLASKNIPNVKIRLISDKPYFDYHAALYRLVSGRSPMEAYIPLADIFENTNVEVCIDKVAGVDTEKQIVHSDNDINYSYDYLVVAVGGQASYFGILGIEEHAFTLKNIDDALKLRKHLEKILIQSPVSPSKNHTSSYSAHIVLIGAGATGVETAGELALYTKNIASRHGISTDNIKIDLVDRASRVLPMLDEGISKIVHDRLESLGVNIMLNKEVLKEDVGSLELNDMNIHARTVIWTAGVRGNILLEKITGAEVNKRGQVVVDPHMRIKGFPNVYVLGDAASTKYSGMAQTALYDGRYIADCIVSSILGRQLLEYASSEPIYAIPVGPGWAIFVDGKIKLFGRLGWLGRRYLDFKVMSTMLPIKKAYAAFRYGGVVEDKDLVETT